MTNVARQTAPTSNPTLAPTDDEALLPVPSNGVPQTILVKVLDTTGTQPVVGFALAPGLAYVKGGLTWPECTEDYGQFLNFVFVDSVGAAIQEIEPTTTGMLMARPAGPAQAPTGQQCSVVNSPGTYGFEVTVQIGHTAHRIDPKIIVTPLHM